jgi:pyridoxal phosphate enzyme (YggS family)
MVTRNELKDRYQRLMDEVAEAAERSGRRASDVLVVAVTKYASPDQVRHLLELGHMDLGESRVQQLQQRAAMIDEFLARHRIMSSGRRTDLPEKVRWHMIGHLQRNKVKPVLPLVKLIHSVDSLRLAEEIQAQAARGDHEVDVLLQVNSSGEESKHGLSPPAVPHLADQIGTMVHLRLRGIMTMAPYSENPELARGTFERTAELFREMQATGDYGRSFNILSMGMSGDFKVAIECGANLIRVGTALFGEPQELEDGEQVA